MSAGMPSVCDLRRGGRDAAGDAPGPGVPYLSGMSRRTRVLLCFLILVIGMPAWIVVSTTLVGMFERPGFLVELAIYVGLGLVWILPLRRVFLGIGRAEPGSRTGTPRQR